MESQQTASALESLAAAVDALISTELTSLPAVEVTDLLSGIEVQRRRLEAVDQRLITEVGERGIAGQHARSSPVDLLVNLLRVSPREAKALGGARAGSGSAADDHR